MDRYGAETTHEEPRRYEPYCTTALTLRKSHRSGHRGGEWHRRGCVRLFADEGAAVAVVDRAEPLSEEGVAAWRTADVRKEADVDSAMGSIVEELGGIDVAFVNAGVESTASSANTTHRGLGARDGHERHRLVLDLAGS